MEVQFKTSCAVRVCAYVKFQFFRYVLDLHSNIIKSTVYIQAKTHVQKDHVVAKRLCEYYSYI